MICIDTLRKDHIGAFGNPWIRTPNLDKFFEQSIVFDRFLPNAIPTIPLRRGLMLGRPVYPYVDDHKFPFGPMGWQPMDVSEVTFAETLRNAGYVTSMIVDPWHYFHPGMNFHKGFHTWEFIRGQEGDPLVLGPTHQDPNEFFDEKMSGTYFQNFYEQFIRMINFFSTSTASTPMNLGIPPNFMKISTTRVIKGRNISFPKPDPAIT
jgi:arylsulfatase A-like enzyme